MGVSYSASHEWLDGRARGVALSGCGRRLDDERTAGSTAVVDRRPSVKSDRALERTDPTDLAAAI
mgnify:CR=1 FL=1